MTTQNAEPSDEISTKQVERKLVVTEVQADEGSDFVCFTIKIDGHGGNPQKAYLSAEGSGVLVETESEGLFLGFIPSPRWRGIGSQTPSFSDLTVGLPSHGLSFADWPIEVTCDDERNSLMVQVPIPDDAVITTVIGEESAV